MDLSLNDRLRPSMFHERQEPDSSLCAQHCLNNLVQDNVWTAADLADLARQLDQREDEARGGATTPTSPTASGSGTGARRRRQPSPAPFPGSFPDEDDDLGGPSAGRTGRGAPAYLNADRSRNMDDSGFFSSQVMDEALKTYNLQLVRWRHPSLRSLQESPEQQEAYVLNLQQHWFVIRRFAHSRHFWYDLNSFHPSPKHVSPLYLGLQIDQAEHEGYNVFVVLNSSTSGAPSSSSRANAEIDPAQTNLPPCEADQIIYDIAGEARAAAGLQGIPSLDEASKRNQAAMDDETVFQSSGQGPALAYSATGGMFGGEDAELNRAIEESLRSGAGASGVQTPQQPTHTRFGNFNGANDGEDAELAAAIAASLADSGGGSLSAKPDVLLGGKGAVGTENGWKEEVMDNAQESGTSDSASKLPQSRADRAQTVDEDEEEEEDEEQEEKPPTAQELRAKRLARFA